MSEPVQLTFCLMDAPFERARTVLGLRLVAAAIRAGHDVTVFAYEGAVALAFALQEPHANSVHGRSVEQEEHPLPKAWIAALLDEARRRGTKLDWINCGLCVDERGVKESIAGCRRGSPLDFLTAANRSVNTLVLATH